MTPPRRSAGCATCCTSASRAWICRSCCACIAPGPAATRPRCAAGAALSKRRRETRRAAVRGPRHGQRARAAALERRRGSPRAAAAVRERLRRRRRRLVDRARGRLRRLCLGLVRSAGRGRREARAARPHGGPTHAARARRSRSRRLSRARRQPATTRSARACPVSRSRAPCTKPNTHDCSDPEGERES